MIRHLNFGRNKKSWLLNLNLIHETLWTGAGSGLLISMLKNPTSFVKINTGAITVLMWICMGLFLRKNHLLRCWGWFSFLNWIGTLTLSLLLKLPPRNLEPWFALWRFFLLRLLCISTLQIYHTVISCSYGMLLCPVWRSITFVDVHLNWFKFLILEGILVIDCVIFLSPFSRCYKDFWRYCTFVPP